MPFILFPSAENGPQHLGPHVLFPKIVRSEAHMDTQASEFGKDAHTSVKDPFFSPQWDPIPMGTTFNPI